MTRKEFFKIIPNFKFTQQVRKAFNLTGTQAYLILYFASHEPCTKLRDTIIDEIGLEKKAYAKNMAFLEDLKLLLIKKNSNNRFIINLNYELLTLTTLLFDGKVSRYPQVVDKIEKRGDASRFKKNKDEKPLVPNLGTEVGPKMSQDEKPLVPNLGTEVGPKMSQKVHEILPISTSEETCTHSIPINIPINNLELINNLIDIPNTLPQKVKVKNPRVKKDIGEERKTFYNALIKRYFEILNTYAAPNFEADKVCLPKDLEAIINKRRVKYLHTLEDWEVFIHKALADDHRSGRNGKIWPCGLSWCVRIETNFAKIMAIKPKESGVTVKPNISSYEKAKTSTPGKGIFDLSNLRERCEGTNTIPLKKVEGGRYE